MATSDSSHIPTIGATLIPPHQSIGIPMLPFPFTVTVTNLSPTDPGDCAISSAGLTNSYPIQAGATVSVQIQADAGGKLDNRGSTTLRAAVGQP